MIVTGNSIAGHVIKHFGNNQATLFPVGIAEGDYTPATIAPLANTAIYVSVQDYGAASPTISDAERGMDRVWHIYASQGVQATYTLQHNRITNGLTFVDSQAQIVQYAGSGNWLGDVTTLQGEGIHTRADILVATGVRAEDSWFTKLADGHHPPQAIPDDAVGNACEPIHINVLANDLPGSSAIVVGSVRIVTQPQHGQVTVNLDGSLTYYARNNYVGEDTLVYEITDEEGQTATATVTIHIGECGIKIPNVFTPDGDGINDFFVIPGLESQDRVTLIVFNRWGGEVYRSLDYKNDWAGRNLNEGVYYYQLRIEGTNRNIDQRGWVLLKRNR